MEAAMVELGGYGSENLFFSVFAGKYPKPYWLVDLEPASALLDIRGVDAIAHVKYPVRAGGGIVRVPIQVKGSWDKVREYYQLHHLARRARVVVLMIRDNYSAEHVLKLFREGVDTVRSANVRYDTYFAKLEKAPLSGRAKEVFELLTERSARRQMATPAE